MSTISLFGMHWNLAVALGIGLLLGLERERRKGEGPERGAAGVRTFALVALLGGISVEFSESLVLVMSGSFVALASLVAYVRRTDVDPGLTTEVALVTSFLLGALTRQDATLAGSLAIAVVVLLAARETLHRFVRDSLSPQELHDGLLFGAAALVVLPMVPNMEVGPYGVLNPFVLWRLVVLVMAISAAGYLAVRILGPRYGLPLAGFAAGFVSSTATIGAMGARARSDPALRRSSVAGALLSSAATVIQLAIVVGATNRAVLEQVQVPLFLAGAAAAAYGGAFAIRALRRNAPKSMDQGRAFDLKVAIIFAATVGGVLLISAALSDWLGETGLVLATAVAGFADPHAAAISAAALAGAGKIQASAAVIPILAGLSTNTITKIVIAAAAGHRRYAAEVGPGLAIIVFAAWGGALVAGAL